MVSRKSMLIVALVSFLAYGCGSDSDKKDAVNDAADEVKGDVAAGDIGPDLAADTAVDVPAPDADVPAPEDIPLDKDDEVVPGDVSLEDVPADVPADVPLEDVVPDQADVAADSFDAIVKVKLGDVVKEVDLSSLEKTTFEDKEAIRLTRITEQAALEFPYNNHYNFIANDNFNGLVDKLEGDYSKLPWYGEMEKGYLFWDAEKEMLRIGWDASLGFPSSLNVKGMGGGTIEAVPVGVTQFVVIAGSIRYLFETTGFATVGVVDYKHPEDGEKPMIPLAEVFTAAGVLTPADWEYKFYGADGFSNNDDNLMPFENTTHGYYEPVKRRIILEEAWDTADCCWSVKNTVLILGIPTK